MRSSAAYEHRRLMAQKNRSLNLGAGAGFGCERSHRGTFPLPRKIWETAMPQHLRPLADRGAANRREFGTVAGAFLVAAIVFGGFYLGSR